MIRRLGTTVVAGLAVLLALSLAAPGLVGLYLAREHGHLIDTLALPGIDRIEAVDFRRGWFRSRLRLRATPARCPAEGCEPLILTSVIHHGPIAFTAPAGAEGRLDLVRAVAVTHVNLAPLFGDARVQPAAPTLTATTRVELDGDVHARARLPETELRIAGGAGAARLQLAELRVDAVRPAAGNLELDVTWPRFSLVAERGGQIAFQGLDAGLIETGDAAGGYRVALESAQVATAGGQGVAFQGLRLDAGATDGDFAMRLSRLTARGNDYGPVLLDGRLALGEAGGLPPLPAMLVALATADTTRRAMLATRPDLRLDRILLGTPNGDLRGQLELRVGPLQATDPALIPALDGSAELLVPVPMMENVTAAVMRHRHPDQPAPTPERVSAAIDGWIERGFIGYREADDAYVVDAALDGPDLLVNGRELADWPSLLERIEPEGQDDGAASGLGTAAGAP